MYKGLKICAVILARSQSTRLKNKMFLPFGTSTIVETVIDRIRKSHVIDDFVFATSTSSEDDIFVDIAQKKNVRLFRGSENDVVGRMIGAVSNSDDYDCVVRVCADNPLLMPTIIDEAIRDLIDTDSDVITPAEFGTYPFGYSMVVMTKQCLERINAEAIDDIYREHVENYCFENHRTFRIRYQEAPRDLVYPDMHLSLDYAVDYERLKMMHAYSNNMDITVQPKGLIDSIKKTKIAIIVSSEKFLNAYISICVRYVEVEPTVFVSTTSSMQNKGPLNSIAEADLIISESEDFLTCATVVPRGCIVVKKKENMFGLFYVGTDDVLYRDDCCVDDESSCEYLMRVLPLLLKELIAGPIRPFTMQQKKIAPLEKQGKGERIGFKNEASVRFPQTIGIELVSKDVQLSEALFRKLYHEISLNGCDTLVLGVQYDATEHTLFEEIKNDMSALPNVQKVVVMPEDIRMQKKLFDTLFIAADGSVCTSPDFLSPIGLISKLSLAEIWQSTSMHILRATVVNQGVCV